MDLLTFTATCALVFTALSAQGPAWQQTCMRPARPSEAHRLIQNGDLWSSYIAEASVRFGMSEGWIRDVIRAESGGFSASTSPVGAMGLMQVMPKTYDELKHRYGLGDDPYAPRNNILAGTAYLREMYDLFGAPGFLAAYNAGPQRLSDHLRNGQPLPGETRRYVAQLAPEIAGTTPSGTIPDAGSEGQQAAPQRSHPTTSKAKEIRRRDAADTASNHDGGPLFFILKRPPAAPPDQR